MHSKLLASVVLPGLIAGGAYAQAPVHDTFPGTEPLSLQASNVVPSDTNSMVAPRLPDPGVGDDGSPAQLLRVASAALQQGQTGLAQEALERAETQALIRSIAPSAIDRPDDNPLIQNIAAARQYLGTGDLPRAQQTVAQAQAMAGQAIAR
jgi:hypothetical protein